MASSLSRGPRAEAPELQKALKEVRERVLQLKDRNSQSISEIEKAAVASLASRDWQPDYIAIRQQSDLERLRQMSDYMLASPPGWSF